VHRLTSFRHRISVKYRSAKLGRKHFIYSVAVLAAVVLLSPWRTAAQEAPAEAPAAPAESSSQQKAGSTASRHGNDFLVRGTVFAPNGLALPGAELRIRRTREKKFQWQTVSNSRGDFAVRVKMGADYEVLVRAKGYQQQSLQVDAKTGERFKDLVFRMQRQEGKKS